jgi:cupin 2 domain-containing protein
MTKMPSRKFPAAKRKILARPFSKSKTNISAQPFAKKTAKIASRKITHAPAAARSHLELLSAPSKPIAIRNEAFDSSHSNLFADIPQHLPEELVHTLIQAAGVRIERIVSHGQASPADFWYDQPQNEWVIVLKGAARLTFEGETVEMKPGDFVNIPAHKKHRVDWTTPDEPTVWLAVFHG